MVVSRSPLHAGMILALTLAAGAAQGVWAPKASSAQDCPVGQACPSTSGVRASSVERKHQVQGSDLVMAAPRATSSAQAGASSVTVFRQADGQDECEICIEGDQVRATHNGQPVEARLIEREGQQIRLMGPDGQQRMVVRVAPEGGAVMQHVAPGAPQRQGGMIARRVSPGQAPLVVQGRPIEVRPGARIQRQRAGAAQPQVLIERRAPGALGSHMIPPPPVPGAPAAPQVRIERRHADGSTQTNTVQIERVPGAQGQFRIHAPQGPGGAAPAAPHIMRRVNPAAPAQPGARVRAPQPPAPPAAPHAGGHVMIQRDGQEPQIIDLGQFMQHHRANPGQPQTFTLPGGGHGQVRAFTVPGGQGNAQTFQFHVQTDDDACCDDCAQDGSCCSCGSASPQAPQRRSLGGAATGQVVIDTGNGQPQVIELGDLGQIHSHLTQHLSELGHVQGLENLHEHLLHLEHVDGLEGLHGLLQGIDLDGISEEIQVELSDAFTELQDELPDSRELQIEIQDAIEEALEGFDFDSLSADIQAQVQAALAESGIEGLNLQDGDFTFQMAPSLFDGATTVEVEDDDDQPAAQPRQRVRTIERPAQVEAVPQVRSGGATAPTSVTTFGSIAEQPRVMLGITMGEAPAETLEHLGIDGSAIRIDRVIEGLPAADAGLKAGAIIVSINGESPATTTLLRECLMACEPGDTIVVEVVDRGARKQIEIELAAYDADALSAAAEAETPVEGVQTWTFEAPADVDHADLQARIRHAVESMTASGVTQIDPEALRAQIEALVRDHVAQFEGMHGFTGQRTPGRVIVAPGTPHAGHGQSGQMLFVQPDAPAAPAAPTAPAIVERRSANVDQRLNELSERMTRLEQRLDRLMQMMEQRGQRD